MSPTSKLQQFPTSSYRCSSSWNELDIVVVVVGIENLCGETHTHRETPLKTILARSIAGAQVTSKFSPGENARVGANCPGQHAWTPLQTQDGSTPYTCGESTVPATQTTSRRTMSHRTYDTQHDMFHFHATTQKTAYTGK